MLSIEIYIPRTLHNYNYNRRREKKVHFHFKCRFLGNVMRCSHTLNFIVVIDNGTVAL